MKTIVLSTGGTGGHVSPAAALAQVLRARGHRVLVMTDVRGQKYAPMFGDIPLMVLPAATLSGSVVARLRGVGILLFGLFKVLRVLRRLRPDAVVGFGGYPSLLPVLGAQVLGIKTYVHEQNAVLGLANVIAAHRAKALALSLPQTHGVPRGARSVVVGNPVRAEIAALASEPYPPLAADGGLQVLVMGGSLGAKIFSDVMPAALALLPEALRARVRLTQQARAQDVEALRAAYAQAGVNAQVSAFIDDVASALRDAHLVIARAGGSTVAELAAVGRPAVFVPYPHHKDRQQFKNAQELVRNGGAVLMDEADMTAQALADILEKYLNNYNLLCDMAARARSCGRPQAAERLADLVLTPVKAAQ
ncbi:MAG: undecaprenyldiphospho-muramoylpentapeptide beta-N-acetylglucosaminyltransferase [Alphaproteobacteria bacterium]|nr:undecaprenyldiphospho-muramoylpentapeptide beta-N-acetylglucosaminyltransferase [Alphaproteobacteria bacterium]